MEIKQARNNAMGETVLLIDDDVRTLEVLGKLLRHHGYTNLLTAESGAEGLKLLDRQLEQGKPVELVICDFRMPGMQGDEVLARIAERSPDTVCIMLTGQFDMESVVAAVNRGAIFRFLLKPSEGYELLAAVREGLQHYTIKLEKEQLQRALAASHRQLEEMNRKLLELNSDLEEQVRQKALKLVEAMYYDESTGLVNRKYLDTRLAQSVIRAGREGSSLALLYIGLNRFNLVKESLSRSVGEELVKKIAARIAGHMRASDTVARTSLDEFCALIDQTDEVVDPALIAERLLKSIAEPIDYEGKQYVFTANIGIAMYPQNGHGADELYTHAEAAMTAGKHQRPNQFNYYQDEYNLFAGARLSLEVQLRNAVERQEFVLYFQPIVNFDGKIVAAEALLRWQHPERGLIAPAEFLPVLEDTEMIEFVGDWVFAESCRVIKRIQCAHITPVPIAVNMSVRQFGNQEVIQNICNTASNLDIDLAAGLLEVEVTESLLMQDMQETKRALQLLNSKGVRIAVDDFGTGYSSLSYLAELPVNCLKVDRSFVKNMLTSDNAKVIVASIIGLAKNLQLRVVAEGIELPEQAEYLQSLGCREFQGYLYSKPVPEKIFVDLLQGPRHCAPNKKATQKQASAQAKNLAR